MKTTIITIIISMLTVCNVYGMSQVAHINGFKDIGGIVNLIGTPVRNGGIGDLSFYKIARINDWIDNPTKHIGEFINHKAGGKLVRPWNHGNLRHNPFNIAKVFSGNGQIDMATLNVGRMHKIQDVFNNKALVDGWIPNARMKKEAGVLLRYARRYKKLPINRLPEWVDKSGPYMTGKKAIIGTVAGASKNAKNVGKIVGKYIMPVAIMVETGLTINKAYKIENMYKNGKINIYERNVKHGENIGTCVTTVGGMGLSMIILAGAPAGPVGLAVVAGTVVGVYLLDKTGKVVGRYVMTKYNEYLKEREKYFADLYKSLFICLENCELTKEEMRACGFTDNEIKSYF